jgi:hypothetical protein
LQRKKKGLCFAAEPLVYTTNRLPVVVVPAAITRMPPTELIALTMPSIVTARTIWTTDQAFVAALIGPLIVDPDAVGPDVVYQRLARKRRVHGRYGGSCRSTEREQGSSGE